MRQRSFKHEQGLGRIEEDDAARGELHLSRRGTVSVSTLSLWRAKFGGLEPSWAQHQRLLWVSIHWAVELLLQQVLANVEPKSRPSE